MRSLFITVAALALGVLALAPAAPATAGGIGLTGYALTDASELARFHTSKPQHTEVVAPITGVRVGEELVGIDFRPRTGELIALGDDSGIYSVSTATAIATLKSTLATPSGPLGLAGESFGVDFNPTVDRLRIVSDADQNLRVNVDTGATTVDVPLAFSATDMNTGADPNVVGVAYTNNDNDEIVVAPKTPTPGKTGTQLFDIDSALDVLATQAPPNAGTLNTVGSLGADTREAAGFDIYSAVAPNGSAVSNVAYASMGQGGTEKLYTVDLATGQVSQVGPFGHVGIQDVALQPDQG